MKKHLLALAMMSTITTCLFAQQEWGKWETWGEQADGTFRNPIIPSDYSDLDCIKVGEDYYAISSTMQYSPGMTVLHSTDLVNWEIVGNAVSDLTQIGPALNWDKMERYGRGVWAGTIRHHNGRFYVFFGAPDEGFFMTSAKRAEGPWEPLTPLLQEGGWDDCTAIWDEKGRGYFLGTCFKDNYKTYIFPMADDCKSIDFDKRRLLNEGNHREASKLIKHGKYYYLVFSEHKGHLGRYVMAKRDKKLTGDFKEERQLLLPCREANEPNQGGIIEGPDGNWYFFTHHGTGDWGGRIASLLPVEWTNDGWPMMGDRTKGEPGTMVWQMAMPKVEAKKLTIGRSDDFDDQTLAPWWQWNYQPREGYWSLTERPGWMRLRAYRPIETNKLLKAGNTLTQRAFRTKESKVIVKMDLQGMSHGQRAGLAHFASKSGALGVVCEGDSCFIELRNNDQTQRGAHLSGRYLWIKSEWGLDGLSRFSFSTDGDNYTPLGTSQLSWGFYRGDRIGIYCFNDFSDTGYVDVDYLHYHMEK